MKRMLGLLTAAGLVAATAGTEPAVERDPLPGRHAYLAYGSAGLFIVDISDPGHPHQAAMFPTDRPAERLALQDGRLFVTTGIGGA